MRYLFALLLLSGCGHGLESSTHSAAPEFARMVEDFARDAHDHNVDVPTSIEVVFGETPPDQAAHCLRPGGLSSRSVVVNLAWWARLDSRQRRVVIYHELGHCLLNRPHRDDLLPSGLPASFMHSTLMLGADFTEAYLSELFHD